MECAFAERNPSLKLMLQNICTDPECDGWYCCPIEDGDRFSCITFDILKLNPLFVGPKCIDKKSGQKGTCKKYDDCKHNDVTSLDVCGIYCCNNFYCCPDAIVPVNQTITDRECHSYTKYLHTHEIVVPMNLYVNRSICTELSEAAGGVYVEPGEYPHMAALGYKPDNEILWKCGGSLVSDKFVLTAGHCLNDHYIGAVRKILIGVIDLLIDIKVEDCPEEFDVARLIPHPDYNPKFVYNDIGIIEIVGTVTFNYHIRPLCLPYDTERRNEFYSMGWGATGPGEDESNILIKVEQDLFTYEECQNQYDVGRRYPQGIINETQICAGSKFEIQSTCPGDSGGPLVGLFGGSGQLVYVYGIVSFGNPCGFSNSPGIYTNIIPYIKWIEAVVWNT